MLAGGFEALGKGMDSLLITLIRQLLVIPPLAVCLSRVWGLAGVWTAFPVAEGLAALVAVLFRCTLRRLQAPGGGVKA